MFRAHVPSANAWKNFVCALKVLANQQTGADSLVDTIFEGLQEQNKLKIAHERRFVEVDSNEAVKIGDLEKNSDAINVITFQFDSLFRMQLPEKGQMG